MGVILPRRRLYATSLAGAGGNPAMAPRRWPGIGSLRSSLADPVAPGALSSITVTAGLGCVLVAATPAADNTARVKIWYSANNTLDPATDRPFADYPVTPGVAFTGKAIGDKNQTQLIVDYSFDNGLTNFIVSGGSFSASAGLVSNAGTSGLIRQLPLLKPLKPYNWFVRSTAWTAGTARFFLGASAVFAPAFGAVGDFYGTETHNALGTAQLGLQYLTGSNGTIDFLSVYERSDATLPQGPGYVLVAPANRSGIIGPVTSHAVIVL